MPVDGIIGADILKKGKALLITKKNRLSKNNNNNQRVRKKIRLQVLKTWQVNSQFYYIIT